MDKLEAMNVFVTIVERGSLSAAAEHLDLSRTKVTRYLGELESWMDTRLLHRTTRRLSLTSAGKETLEVARELLALEASLAGIRNQNREDLKGQLRITASYSIVDSFLMDAINRFITKWPEVSIDVISTDQTVNLVESRIDLAIRITNELTPNIVAKQLGECRSVICASPQYLQKKGTPANAQDLAHHNCLSFSYFGRTAWTFHGPNGSESVPIKGNISANTSEVLLSATLKGNGISMLPFPSVEALVRQGQLVQLLPEWKPKILGVHAIYGTRKQVTPLLRAFIDHLSSEMEQSKSW
ncbi:MULTISPECIES: LysR family transcriptional regulator [Vibrio]|uniref:LysR family transcriptional regulator n=2 Tax=Vibrio TaxID=662 RepID=A0AAN0LKQ1_9VIBR|nr:MULTISPECIES: LysR family transcriptional regulator [Vibrio]KNH13551.1 LysR family transcriptional regulator [Vibrio lentus]MBY7660066.1 LysR family transcriptional regulator [Vibrio atlanticus]ERM61018.1 LysR-family transcriptional regulator [Vibrio cyclitrophicus FF75]KAA8600165.1 LysR-family transcriptional regulator [Vibrio cyclitrophicus]MBE8605797.1 LysR family transcriptional regulator [Vibrio sp. OPT10]|tara:strand:+ start:1212 stop:2105 length:894 start_codon:yes stop_codon:yes gene_type:complete